MRDGKDIGKDEKDDPHWPHCFDYMYQVRKSPPIAGLIPRLPKIVSTKISSAVDDPLLCGQYKRKNGTWCVFNRWRRHSENMQRSLETVEYDLQ